LNDDHQLTAASYPAPRCRDGQIVTEFVPARSALNARLRDDYLRDCSKGSRRWNAVVEQAGFACRLTLPQLAFNRRIGCFAGSAPIPMGG
jgi:benzoyl-CoA 2,3-epoxidase subunit B